MTLMSVGRVLLSDDLPLPPNFHREDQVVFYSVFPLPSRF